MQKKSVVFCAVAALWLHPAAAQQQPRQQPTDPAAIVPPLRHHSAFAGYQPLGDDKPADWRNANDEVARAGGHVGILKSSPATSSKGHAGHQPGAQP